MSEHKVYVDVGREGGDMTAYYCPDCKESSTSGIKTPSPCERINLLKKLGGQHFGGVKDFACDTGSQCKSNAVSGDEILKQMDEAKVLLSEHTQKLLDNAQNIFKECFSADADYKRGDVVVFPLTRRATYDRLNQMLPSKIMKQVKLDLTGAVEKAMIINGDSIGKPTMWDMSYQPANKSN